MDFEVKETGEDQENLVEGTTIGSKFFYKFMDLFCGSKLFFAAWSSVSAIILTLVFYMNYAMYNPAKRDMLDTNIYSGNELIINSDEIANIVANIENELGITIDEECYEDYCLLNAVLENENLDEEEKDVFYRIIQIIKENPYINKEEAYHSLLNVDVLHKIRPYFLSKNTEGIYSYNYESIGIFVDDPEYRVLIHEIIHCVFENDKTINLPTYFKEGVTELLANEYFSNKPFVEMQNYPFEVSIIKMLCEVSSVDAVLEAYSTGDMSIIAKEIAKYSYDETEAMNALNTIDLMMKQYNDPKENGELDKEKLINGFIPLFRSVIEAKYEPEEHSRISYFYNEILIANIFEEKPYDSYVDDLFEFGIDNKGYFSEKFKQVNATESIVKKVKSTDN